MTTPVILQRLILDPKTFITDKDFYFSNNLNLVYGNYGSGKTTLLKIIKSLTDNKENIDPHLFKILFSDKKVSNESYVFKYEFNSTLLHLDNFINISLTITEFNVEVISEPALSTSELEQIIQNLKIFYLSQDNILSPVNSINKEGYMYFRVGERT